MAEATDDPKPPIDDATTDLPGLPTWPAVYVFVLGTFIVWIILLTALSRAFS
jgi:hypothetical protein